MDFVWKRMCAHFISFGMMFKKKSFVYCDPWEKMRDKKSVLGLGRRMSTRRVILHRGFEFLEKSKEACSWSL